MDVFLIKDTETCSGAERSTNTQMSENENNNADAGLMLHVQVSSSHFCQQSALHFPVTEKFNKYCTSCKPEVADLFRAEGDFTNTKLFEGYELKT